MSWKVKSVDGGNPADIGEIKGKLGNNYGLAITDGAAGPGARHVNKIDLDPSDTTKYSALTGGSISGDLDGDLFLQKSSGGSGGTVSFTIAGDVMGDITIPRGAGLTIEGYIGTYYGTVYYVDIGEITGGDLIIEGGVDAGIVTIGDLNGKLKIGYGMFWPSSITIDEMGSTAELNVGYLTQNPGTTYAHITINSDLPTNAKIDMRQGPDQAGYLNFGTHDVNGEIVLGKSYGDIIADDVTGTIDVQTYYSGLIDLSGDMSGTMLLNSDEKNNDLHGQIEIGGVMTAGATITVFDSTVQGYEGEYGDLASNGSILISGFVDGIESGAEITIEGDALGDIDSNGDVGGAVTIHGQAEGWIYVSADVLSTGEILVSGDITEAANVFVIGDFDGNICAGNLCPGGPLPDNIDLDFGENGTICDRTPGDFPVDPPDPESGGASCTPGALYCHGGDDDGDPCYTDEDCTSPGTCWPDCWNNYAGADCIDLGNDIGRCAVPKNRYLSIDPTTNGEDEVAYRVELTEAADYPTAVGMTWWVDEPLCYDYPNGEVDPNPDPPDCSGPAHFGWVAKLTDTAVTQEWTESLIHITGCPIAPAVTYEVRASGDGGECFSAALEIYTSHDPPGVEQAWGDLTGGPGTGGAWLPPEYATNFGDIGAALRTFENLTTGTGHPSRIWVDFEINQVINMADIDFLVKAFEGVEYADIDLPLIGTDPADCDSRGDGGGGGGGGDSTPAFSLTAVPELINADELVDIDVYLDSMPDLRTYQVQLEVTGGDAGCLDLEELVIDTNRPDFVFESHPAVLGLDMTGGRLGAVRMDDGVPVTGPAYLGTFRFRASQDADGLFDVDVAVTVHTFLRDSDGVELAYLPGDGTYVGVGIECFLDEHCDDANDCTDDICVSQECVHKNEPIGTPCDDGRFCTATDECDGNGVCVGDGNPCPPRAPKCCELTDECVGALQQCPSPGH